MKRKFLIVCLLAVSQSLIIQAQSYDGDLKESYSDDGERYTGKIEWKVIANFATSKMQSFVSIVTSSNY